MLYVWTKKELVDKKAEFWVLMAQGSTLIAACEAVGVDRRSGRHWRQATGGRIPRKRPAPSGRYLSLEERLRIADLHLAGETMSKIAADLSRAVSTVSRELTRNAPTAGPRGVLAGSTRRTRRINKPSCEDTAPRPASSTILSWPRRYRRNCA